MTTHEDPQVARRRVRIALRKGREAGGLTQLQAARDLDWSLSKLVRIEAGTVGLSTTDLLALLHLYEVPESEADSLVEMARAARRPPWYRRYEQVLSPAFRQYLSYEGAASVLMAFHPLTIPGPLQTEEYARAILEASGASHVDERLKLRIERQARRERQGSPSLDYVIDEAALHRQVGGQVVMRAQLTQLKRAIEQPAISLRVIPFAAGAHASMTASFTILEFDDRHEDALYCEGETSSSIDRDDQVAVAAYRERFGRLSSMSMPPAQVSGLIGALIEKLQHTAQAHEPR